MWKPRIPKFSDLSFLSRIRVVFAGAGLSAVCIAGVAIVSTLQLNNINNQVNLSLERQVLLEEGLQSLLDIETGERGYIITENPRFLEPYYDGLKDGSETYQQLQEYYSRTNQLSQLEELRDLAREYVGLITEIVELQESGNRTEAIKLIQSERPKRLLDQIRVRIEALQNLEESRLDARSEGQHALLTSVYLSLVGLVFLVISLLILANAFVEREFKQRAEAEEELTEAYNKLSQAAKSFLSSEDYAVASEKLHAILNEADNKLNELRSSNAGQ